MERIEFTYVFHGNEGEEKVITLSKKDEDGLHDCDVCEMFMDFMRSVGFSEQNVIEYFRE